MKIILICFIVFSSSLIGCNTAFKQTNKNSLKSNISSDTTFEYHFYILDSARKAYPKDTIYSCCTPSINFMEIHTGIEGHSDGTLLGKLSFSKDDLRRWHEWFDQHRKK
jgi:hypothetical protein